MELEVATEITTIATEIATIATIATIAAIITTIVAPVAPVAYIPSKKFSTLIGRKKEYAPPSPPPCSA